MVWDIDRLPNDNSFRKNSQALTKLCRSAIKVSGLTCVSICPLKARCGDYGTRRGVDMSLCCLFLVLCGGSLLLVLVYCELYH
jgi:hypothetical protein